MDKIYSFTQFVLAIIIFLCALIGAVSHTVMGYITSLPGYLVALVFITLTWYLVRLSWKEFREASNK